MVCDKDGKKDIYHFMLHCTAYNVERSHSTHLQQPYIESDEDILEHFLFDTEDIEEKKELLFSIMENKTTSNENNIITILRFNLKLTFSCTW